MSSLAVVGESTECSPVPFRDIISAFATGITVVTARLEGIDYGLTASAVTSVSLEPPLLLICLNERTRTQAAILRGGVFAVNVLAEHQLDVAERFASPSPDRFAGIGMRLGALGQPLLEDALAHVECRLVDDFVGGTHRILLGSVARASAASGAPLVRFGGSYGGFDQRVQRAAA